MLSMTYSSRQLGPEFEFQISSQLQFFCDDLCAIAYQTNTLPENFSYLPLETIDWSSFCVGEINASGATPGDSSVIARFREDNGLKTVFSNKDITVTLVRSNSEDSSRGLVAVAHFDAHIEQSGDKADTFQQCKFDTLTFEQLGTTIKLPKKQDLGKTYPNMPAPLTNAPPQRDTDFPNYVFDDDAHIVLPSRK